MNFFKFKFMALKNIRASQPRKSYLLDADKSPEHCCKQISLLHRYKEPYYGGLLSTEFLQRMEENSSVDVKKRN